MLRRLMFFGVGALISIIVLSIGDNRIRDTFIAYSESYNIDKRVKGQFRLSDHKIYLDSNSNKSEIESFLENSWVNWSISDRDSYPQVFVLDNVIGNQNQRLYCRYYDMEKRDETIFDPTKEDSVTSLKRLSIVEFVKLEKDIPISSRSYISYFYLTGIFLLIMIPVIFFCRRLIRRIGLKDE
jgi:hypothetical protein